MKKLFLKLRYLLLAIFVIIACYIYVLFVGNEYTCELDYRIDSSNSSNPVALDQRLSYA